MKKDGAGGRFHRINVRATGEVLETQPFNDPNKSSRNFLDVGVCYCAFNEVLGELERLHPSHPTNSDPRRPDDIYSDFGALQPSYVYLRKQSNSSYQVGC